MTPQNTILSQKRAAQNAANTLLKNKSASDPRKKSDWLKHIASTSYDVMWDWDIASGRMYVGESVKQVLGFQFPDNHTSIAKCLRLIAKEDRKRVKTKLISVFKSTALSWNDKFSFVKDDGVIASTMARASIVRDENGRVIRLIGALQDITKLLSIEEKLAHQTKREKKNVQLSDIRQSDLEDQLSSEISLKEQQIASAVVDAEELQRAELGRELHDNVNQMLGASRLYLDMARTEEGDITLYLERSQEYTMSAIEAIRALSKDLVSDKLVNFGFVDSVDKLVEDTMQTMPIKINCVIEESVEKILNLKFKLNLFRIIQEQINNILKYANAKTAFIQLSQNRFAIILSINDNGSGFDTACVSNGIGIANIKSRALLFKGAVTIVSKPDEGCTLKIIFPLNSILFIPKD